jgi:hypothetical protein
MSFHRWLQDLRSALSPRRGQRQNHRRGWPRATLNRPNLEVLEARTLLSFSPVVNSPLGFYSRALVAGDFNNDTVIDLAVAARSLLGHPNSTFTAAGTYGNGSGSLSDAVGDFDRDGNLDVASANSADVSVSFGKGDGTFGTTRSFAIADSPSSVAVGDFNGDGLLDLEVISNTFYPSSGWYYYDQHYEGHANVLLGDGAGGFSEPDTASLGGGYHASAVVSDFNGDGIDDVATANIDFGTVSVLLDGLGRAPDFYAGYEPTSLAAGDVNGDHVADLITANSDGTVSVLLGEGWGGFGAAANYPSPAWGQSVAVGDFNHDGMLDIVTSGNRYEGGGNTGCVQVLLGHGDGTFAIPIRQSLPFGTLAYGVAVGNFGGDGLPDVAITSKSDTAIGNVSVFIDDGSWSAPGTPSVSINDATVKEGNTGTVNATFTLTLSAATSVDVTVHYATADVTAAAGSDYTAASGTVTIPAGQLGRTVTIAVKGDRLPEPTETFAVNLAGATNATIGDGQGVGTILDDEPRVSITDVSRKEGNKNQTTQFTFKVTLSAAYDQPVTVSFQTTNGTATTGDGDYVGKTGTLTFNPGETSKTITIDVKGDSKKESDETFYLDLFGLGSNALFIKSRGLGTILNDD